MQKELSPEEQEELKKKLESMSPEELKNFQKQQCIFCHIVSGKVSAKKIFEDDKTLGILDINPANPGHVLLLPKEHHMIMPQLPEDELEHIFIISKQISNALLKSLDVRGTNIMVANGPAAGQRAQHFMIHIIPRKEGDGIKFELPNNSYTDSDLDVVAQKIKAKLNSLLGIEGVKDTKSALDVLKKEITEPVEAEFEETPDKNVKDDPKKDKDNEDKGDDDNDKGKDDDGADKGNDDDIKDDDNGDDEEKDELDLDAISRVLNG